MTLPAGVELIARIDWLIRLRWMAAAGVVVTVEVARRIFPFQLPLNRFYGVVAGLAIYNLVFWLVARRLRRAVPGALPIWADALVRVLLPRTLRSTEIEGEAIRAAAFTSIQIFIDTIALAVLLHFSGGIENPFLYFFVFHLIIASILLSRRATYLQAIFGLVLISAVAVGELLGILRHYPLEGVWWPGSYQDPMLVGAQLFVLGTTLGIAAYMGSTIAVRLRIRQRDAMLLSRQVADKAEELRVALDRLRLVEQAKSQYMRKVAHELRGPLGTIQTSLKVALQDQAGGLSERARDMIGRAERRAGELAELTEDLLVLSRAREADLSHEATCFRPAEIVTREATEAEAAAARAGVRLRFAVEGEVGELVGDPKGFQQLVANLIGNALRYTPRGGEVEVGIRQVGEAVRFEVRDTGIGIATEDQERIFDEFYRSHAAREQAPEGTGLGLAIVKAVVERHGGTLAVDSAVGSGTRFVVNLPLGLAQRDDR